MYATLNISATSIRVLSVKGRQVEKWGDTPLAAGLVRDGLILEPKTVAAAIDELFQATGIPRERVITCLSNLSFTYRILSLPRMKPALLEEAIQRGVKKEIPLPLEELYLSWQAVGGERDELSFFVLGVPRNLADAAAQTLETAGLEPYLMDLKPLALARAANRGDAIIVDMETDCFDIVLVTNGVPAIMRTISPRGGGATLEDNAQRLTDELSKTVKFYNSSYPETPLSPTTPLLLTGELSAGAMAGKFIQDKMAYPVEPLVPPLNFPPDLPLAQYAANMGLVLKKVPPKTASKGDTARFQNINLNILSGKYRKPRAQPVPRRHLLGILALIIAAGLLYPMYQVKSQADAETMRLQTELSGVSQELEQARLAGDEAGLVEDIISEITGDAAALKQEYGDLLAREDDFAGNLKLVTDTLPPDTDFTSIDIGADRITVAGETDSPFAVVSYAKALETRGGYQEIRITEIDETEAIEAEAAGADTDVITFDIVISKYGEAISVLPISRGQPASP